MREDGSAALGDLPGILIRQEVAILFCEEEPRRERVDPDLRTVLLGDMHREPLREVAHRGLGGRVPRYPGQRAKRVHRGDVEDAAALLVRHHPPAEHLSGQDRAPEEIQRHHPFERVERQIEETSIRTRGRLRRVAARRVHQDVHPSERLTDFRTRRFQRLLQKHIRTVRPSLRAPVPQRVRNPPGLLLRDIADRQSGTHIGQPLRDRGRQHPAPAREHSHLSL